MKLDEIVSETRIHVETQHPVFGYLAIDAFGAEMNVDQEAIMECAVRIVN